MKPDDLDDVADRVSDGAGLPWDRLLETDDLDEREVLEQLRILAAIARVHRTTETAMEPGPAPPSAASQADLPVERWAHLELRGRLGHGGYGEVFRAWDPRLEREVALKLLTAPGRRADSATVVREAQLLARVRHPNVLTVHGALVADGRVGIWTELVDGQTLDTLVRRGGPLSADEAALIGVTICRAVGAVHAAGLLHRDIKAQNVMRARGGRVVLMDFGAGGELAQGEGPPRPALAGTPAYLAPEVLSGQPASVRSDVYSIGVLLYFAVSAAFPVPGGSLDELRAAHARGDRQPLQSRRPDLPQGYVRAIERACAADPGLRPESPAALEHDLLHVLGSEAKAASSPASMSWPRRLVTAALGVALLAAWVAWAARPRDVDAPFFTRLTYRHGKVHAARFGPEGGTVVYAASWGREPAQAYLTTIGARESRPIGPPHATLLDLSSSGEMALALSPRFIRGYVHAGVLARAPLSGGRPRHVLEDVQAADWSPDGQEVAVVRDIAGRTQLEFPVGTVLYQGAGWVSSPRISPDGSMVAFVDHPTLNDDSGRIAVARAGGQIEHLTGDWISVQGLAWSPDGREVWFTASEAGNIRALYAAGLDKRVRLLYRSSARLRLHDVSTDGQLLVTQSDERVELLVRTAGSDHEKNLSWLDWSIVRDISADGSTLLFNESGEGGGERYGVYLREVSGGDAVRLADGSGISLSPDGRWVLAVLRGDTPRLVLLPTGAGSARELPGNGLRYQQWGAWFPDGRKILFAARGPGSSRLFVQAVEGDTPPVPIGEEGMTLGSAGAVSPDGTRIAALGPSGRIALYSPEGRQLSEVSGTNAGELPLQWTPDGERLYVAARGAAPVPIHIVDLATSQRRLWRELMPAEPTGAQEILRIAVSRDGRTWAYSLNRELSELYLMTLPQ